MSEAWDYAENVLGKVSRTFALNIGILGRKLRRPVLLAYLYMRIADTVEDDPAMPAEEKARLLGLFSEALRAGSAEAAGAFARELPESWARSEKDDEALCANAGVVIPLLAEMPEAAQRAVKSAVEEMCGGMAEFAGKREARGSGWFSLESVDDLDRYCYFVAGLVGNMLTELFVSSGRFFSERKRRMLRERAVSFGLALQLVNIIKDLQDDSSRRVCFVPEELCRKHGIGSARELFAPGAPKERRNAVIGELLAKARRHLRDAQEYIKFLPRAERRMRLFCLLPSLMAADNLRLIGDGSILFEQGKRAKISRESVAGIVRSSMLFYWSNSWIGWKFSKLAQCRI